MATSAEKERQGLEFWHKNLRNASWQLASNPTPDYNCIAFVLGITNQRWQPEPLTGDYWPDGIPQTDSEEAWLACFQKFGFIRCGNGNYESGFEKIVIYCDGDLPQHVAKLKSDGIWHSKMGQLADILHPLDALSYGSRRIFLKRPLPAKKPSKTAQRRSRRK